MNRFVGTWRLVSWEITSPDGSSVNPFGADALGYIMYTADGYMSVQLLRRGRPKYRSGDFTSGTAEETAAAASGFLSYCGPFEVIGKSVIHHCELSSFPNFEGMDQIRSFEFDGDRLTLLTLPVVLGGRTVGNRLVWERMR